jgi:hypothetical protein
LAKPRRAFRKSGTDGSNPVPSSGESANHRFLSGGAKSASNVLQAGAKKPDDRGDLLRQNQEMGWKETVVNEQANKDDKPFRVDDARQRLIEEVDRF